MLSLFQVPNWLPRLAGHTLVQIDDTKLVVMGGFSTQWYFSDKVLEYDAGSGMIAWQEYDHLLLSGSIPLGKIQLQTGYIRQYTAW